MATVSIIMKEFRRILANGVMTSSMAAVSSRGARVRGTRVNSARVRKKVMGDIDGKAVVNIWDGGLTMSSQGTASVSRRMVDYSWECGGSLPCMALVSTP